MLRLGLGCSVIKLSSELLVDIDMAELVNGHLVGQHLLEYIENGNLIDEGIQLVKEVVM